MDKTVAKQYLENLQRRAYSSIGVNAKEIANKYKELFLEVLEEEIKQRENTVSRKELEQYREWKIKDFESTMKIQLPTKYENPLWYSTVLNYSRDIEEGTKIWQLPDGELKQHLEEFLIKKPRLLFGTMPMGRRSVNAMSITVPSSEDYLVVFENELFIFCYLLSKIVARSMYYEGKKENNSIFMPDEKNVVKIILHKNRQ